jgi:hypothetical protein
MLNTQQNQIKIQISASAVVGFDGTRILPNHNNMSSIDRIPVMAPILGGTFFSEAYLPQKSEILPTF